MQKEIGRRFYHTSSRPNFNSVQHVFDLIALAIDCLMVWNFDLGAESGRDVWQRSFFVQLVKEPIHRRPGLSEEPLRE